MPLDEFTIESPKGSHFAQTYELFGSTIGDIGEWGSNEFSYSNLKVAAKDALRAVNLLHENGIVYGCRFSFLLEPKMRSTITPSVFVIFTHGWTYFNTATIVLKSIIDALEMWSAMLCFEPLFQSPYASS